MINPTVFPQVGEGCTIRIGSDSYAATIIKVETTRTNQLVILTQEDKATRIDLRGMDEHQEYNYELNPKGTRRYFRLDRVNERIRWREVTLGKTTGKFKLTNWSCGLIIGVRAAHHDYSF